MKLDRHNYESWFILYLDNELKPEERRMVEAFAAENPDLKEELDLLLQTRMEPDESVRFDHKESLLFRNAAAINNNNYEEWLLCYMDNELTAEERKSVESFLAANPAAQTELEFFQRTRLQPEMIQHPDKASLYRSEKEKVRVIAISWRRIAIAAALLLAVSTTALLVFNRNNSNSSTEVAGAGKINAKKPVTDPQKTVQPNSANHEESVIDNPAPDASSEVAVTQPDKKGNPHHTEQSVRVSPAPEKQETVVALQQEQPKGNNLPKPDLNPNVNPVAIPQVHDAIAYNDNPKTLTNSAGNSPKTSVTEGTPDTYINQSQLSASNENADAVFAGNDGKKNKLRGFFRKVTRNFEKRTNMKATDGDDDRLLIAGLAIKLN